MSVPDYRISNEDECISAGSKSCMMNEQPMREMDRDDTKDHEQSYCTRVEACDRSASEPSRHVEAMQVTLEVSNLCPPSVMCR